MNRRQFIGGLLSAAVVATAPIPILGRKVRDFRDHFVAGDYIRVSGVGEKNGLYRVTEVESSAITIDDMSVEKID